MPETKPNPDPFEFDVEALATVYNELMKTGVDQALAFDLVSAEATAAMSPLLVAEAVGATAALASAEAMQLVVSRTTG